MAKTSNKNWSYDRNQGVFKHASRVDFCPKNVERVAPLLETSEFAIPPIKE